MKPFALFVVLIAFTTCFVFGQDVAAAAAAVATGPEPAPWWMRVEETQALALKWLAALTVIGGALTAFVLFMLGKIQEIKARVEKQADRSDTQQQQIHDIALAAMPTPPSKSNTATEK